MSADTLCATCRKKVHVGRSGSLTQWLFTDDSCECAGKVLKLKLSEDEKASGPDGSRMCGVCGKLRSDSRQGSLTQWVFGAEKCRCDYDKLNPGDLFDGTTDTQENFSDLAFSSEIDPELIGQLESGEIDYHGFSPDSFPFDRYRIISEKGRGNAGIVYEAWDCMLRKRVAIKTMFSYQWSADELMRFQSEARSASKLNHPNILQILDFGASVGGQPYMVMEFVDGTTLKESIDDDGAIPSDEAIPVFLQICEGLRHAHQQGIFHRDVKCSNIMIGKSRNGGNLLKVIDFGIASLAHGQTTAPADGEAQALTIVGSPLYMSPDQMHGIKFDDRSEVYSVGCVMFETLCGAVPFDGESVMATMSMHANAPVPDLIGLDGQAVVCHPRLADAIAKCLEKDPDDRFQSVDELHQHLTSLQAKIASERIEAKISNQFVEQEQQDRRNRAIKAAKSSAIAFAVIAVVAVIGDSLYKIISAVPAPDVVPSTSKVVIYDREDKKKDDATAPLFDDLTSDRLSARYQPTAFRLVIDGTASGDPIIERALKRKLHIKELEVFNISLSPNAFQKLHLLRGIDSISATDVDYPDDLSWLAKCSTIKVLRLDGINADDTFFQIVSKLKGLQQLELDGTKPSASGLALLEPLPINTLSLKTAKVTAAQVKEIVKFKHLVALFIGDSGITNSDIRQLGDLKELTTLGLTGTLINDETLQYLGTKLPQLSTLYVFRCSKITQAGVRNYSSVRPRVSVMYDQSGDLEKGFAPVE